MGEMASRQATFEQVSCTRARHDASQRSHGLSSFSVTFNCCLSSFVHHSRNQASTQLHINGARQLDSQSITDRNCMKLKRRTTVPTTINSLSNSQNI